MNEIEACFFVPVCKSDIQRVLWTIESIRKFCNNYIIYVLVDGQKTDFEKTLPTDDDDVIVIYIDKPTNRHWGLIWRMQNNGMREALKRNDLSDGCIFVKIDADAVVCRNGFIEEAQRFFRKNPGVGQVGQVFTNIVGLPLKNRGWENYFKNRFKPVGMLKLWIKYILEGYNPFKAWSKTRQFKDLIQTARSNGWPDGCFAIGGSYMLRKTVVERMEEHDLLLNSALCFIPDVGEDVLMTPHVYYLGYTAMDSIGENGLFAVYGEELIAPPEEFKKDGNYIVHPLKYGYTKTEPTFTEEELVRYFID